LDGLARQLAGYTEGRPFLVLSDAFPEGLIPRPTAPDLVLGMKADPAQRKQARTHRWLPSRGAGQPINVWMNQASASDIMKPSVSTQNTINRITGTTGTGQFAPRQVERISFKENAQLDLFAVLDQARLSAPDLEHLLTDIGRHGYGRDATTGLGKFEVTAVAEHTWPLKSSRHWLTLAPCAPDPPVLDADRCYYLPVTRFGRHGNFAVTLGKPFKSPLLMAATGALLKSREPGHWMFHGRGLGGSANPISAVMPETVHQGYSPVVPITMGTSS
jgi:CRISPR-associated protein Csm4